MATILLIDGENFKGKIKDVFKNAGVDEPVWHDYNFKGLLDRVLAGITVERSIIYFAKLKMHPERPDKSRALIEEQRRLKTHLERSGIEVVLAGRVAGHGTGKSLIFKEKGVDVRIAVDMIVAACDKVASDIILASSDSDLQPAIHEVKNRGIVPTYLGFEVNPNKGLSYTCHKTILIRNSEVIEFEKITLDLGV